jgi:hypothetical protein
MLHTISISALSNSEQVFYKDHQDSFTQKTFVDDPEGALSQPGQILIQAAAFLIPASLSIIITESSRQGHTINMYTERNHKLKSLTVGGLVGLLSLWLYRRHTKSSITREAFSNFLQTYDTLKPYLSPSLIASFDIMFREYMSRGENYFSSDEFKTSAKAIQIEIIKNNPAKFDKKNEKTLTILVCLTAITLVAINAYILDEVQRGLRTSQDNLDYWGMRAVLSTELNRAEQEHALSGSRK